MTAFQNKSFSVGSPGTKDYADKHQSIFNCADTGDLKSKCACEKCVAYRNESTTTENK